MVVVRKPQPSTESSSTTKRTRPALPRSCKAKVVESNTKLKKHPKSKSTSSSTITCIVCDKILTGDEDQINLHVNQCLNSHQEEQAEFPSSIPAESSFEWNGTTRVMTSSLRPFHEADRVRELDVPDDLNIAEDESLQYGSPQFDDSRIILPSCDEEGFYRWELQKEQSSSSNGSGKFTSSSAAAADALSLSKDLLIASLKEKLKAQQAAMENSPKCLLCQEHYKSPLTSVLCWHVHCEECWFRALGSKKTCPQCTIITRPSDLRRIYL